MSSTRLTDSGVPAGTGAGALVAGPDGPVAVELAQLRAVEAVPMLDAPDPTSPRFWQSLEHHLPVPVLFDLIPFIDPDAETGDGGPGLSETLASLAAARSALVDTGEDGLAFLERRDAEERAAAQAGAAYLLADPRPKTAPVPFDPRAWELALAEKAAQAVAKVRDAWPLVERVDALIREQLADSEPRGRVLERLRDNTARGLAAADALTEALAQDVYLRSVLDAVDAAAGVRADYRAGVLGIRSEDSARHRYRAQGHLSNVNELASVMLTSRRVLATLLAWDAGYDSRLVRDRVHDQDAMPTLDPEAP